jgi:Dolichyl-phosphate-mannose-protein mannosyltransferase
VPTTVTVISQSLPKSPTAIPPATEQKLAFVVDCLAAFACILQVLWFASKSFSFIDYDALSYIGIARYLRAGEIQASINAFRSPLISWLIAAVPFSGGHLLNVGKVINIGCYGISVALVYRLTDRLWQSRLAASIAALWFSLSRGLAATSVVLVSPDFLLTVLVLVYFLLLLRCLRFNRTEDWFLLGAVHGLAYLAKAVALPWLVVATLLAATITAGKVSQRIGRLALAMSLPLLTAGLWGAVVHSKYKVFTTGSQFKTNFVSYQAQTSNRDSRKFLLLEDTTPDPNSEDPSILKMDAMMVNDPMPPHSPSWQRRVAASQILRSAIANEGKTVPVALKELTILLTPGGVLGFLLIVRQLVHRKSNHSDEFRFTLVVAVSALALISAYGMLVFLTTYAYPIIAVVIAVTAPVFVADRQFGASAFGQRCCIVLALAGLLVSFVYRSSPYRTLDRDFEASCHDAAQKIEAKRGSRMVSVGTGPYPAQGVGWEAGYLAAYFADQRIVAIGTLPGPSQTADWMNDIHKAAADTVLIWGKPADIRYQIASRSLTDQYRGTAPILDPAVGEVGRVVFGRIE